MSDARREVRRSGPGSCPVCGMALEPLVATASTGPEVMNFTAMTRRFLAGTFAGVSRFHNLLEIDLICFPTYENTVPPQYNMAAVASGLPVVLWCGWPFFARAECRYVTAFPEYVYPCYVGTGVALGFNRTAIFPYGFPASFRNMDGTMAVYFEAAAVITVLVLLGQVRELRAQEQTSERRTALLNLPPKPPDGWIMTGP